MKTTSFYYQFNCNPNFELKRFDVSLILIIACSVVLVGLLSHFGKILSFKIVFRTKASHEIAHNIEDDHIF